MKKDEFSDWLRRHAGDALSMMFRSDDEDTLHGWWEEFKDVIDGMILEFMDENAE